MEHTENPGEVLFVNQTTATEKNLRAFYRKTTKSNILTIVAVALCALYGVVNLVQHVVVYMAYDLPLAWSDISPYVLSLIPALLLVLLKLVLPGITAKKQYQSLCKLHGVNPPVYNYQFGDRMMCHTALGQSFIEYTEISRILEAPCGCFLIVRESGGFYIAADSFSLGNYDQFRQFLRERCPNLGKKGTNFVKPTTASSPTVIEEVPEDSGQIRFINETVLTESIYLTYNKKVMLPLIPIPIVFTLLSAYQLYEVINLFVEAASPDILVRWPSFFLVLFIGFVCVLVTVKLWRLPWSNAKKASKHHQNYGSQEEARLHYSIGDRFFIQSADSHSILDYKDITRIVDMDFGCSIIFAKRTAVIIRADGFTQGTYNEFRQFLAEKCPHLNKNRKS